MIDPNPRPDDEEPDQPVPMEEPYEPSNEPVSEGEDA